MARKRLPDRRRVETLRVKFLGREFSVGVGYHNDGKLSEVWCDPPPNMTGNALDFMAKDSATIISVALQWGVPLDDLRKSIARISSGDTDRPATIIGVLLDALAVDVGPGPMPEGWKSPKIDDRTQILMPVVNRALQGRA